MKPGVAVAGSLNMDFVVSVERLPAPGETVLGAAFRTIPGGKGANQACAAGRVGGGRVAVRMIGRVGADVFGDALKASLRAAGVDAGAVRVVEGEPTGVALIWVERGGENSIVVAPGANGTLLAGDMDAMRAAFGECAYVLFQLEIPMEAVAAGLAAAREEGAKTILDPAPARELGPEILGLVDILTPNEGEACALLGRAAGRVSIEEAPELARALLGLGPGAVILKLGHQGAFYCDGTTELFQPGFVVEARDATAAGDVFNGALAVALAEQRGMAAALLWANAAAAISVTRAGAQASIPTRDEVKEFLAARTG